MQPKKLTQAGKDFHLILCFDVSTVEAGTQLFLLKNYFTFPFSSFRCISMGWLNNYLFFLIIFLHNFQILYSICTYCVSNHEQLLEDSTSVHL